MHRIIFRNRSNFAMVLCIAFLLMIVTLSQFVMAQTTGEAVRIEIYLEQSRVVRGESTTFLTRISNGSDVTLQAVELELRNRQLDLAVDDIPSTILPAETVVSRGVITPTALGSFALLPVLSYTTTASTNRVLVLSQELPILDVVSPPTLWDLFVDLPREVVSVLIGVLVGLMTVGLTNLVNHSIAQGRQRCEALEMVQAATRATIAVLSTPPYGPVPSDALNKACSSPSYERLLTLVRNRKRSDVDKVSQALITMNAKAQHYQKVYEKLGGVDKVVREGLLDAAKKLQSSLQV